MVRRQSIVTIAFAALAFGQPAKNLSNEELTKLLEKRENLFFLDVREPEEIKELGSIPGYVNIPVGQLQARLAEVPKDKPIITA
jgi:rhodanese-related sulfurtransferase